jgi:spermidine synthase
MAYDVLIVDSSDPVGPAEGLFGARFYRQAARALKPGGMMVAQAESPTFFPQDFTRVAANMRQTFPIARIYLACVPTYVSGHWAFAIGSTVHDPCAPAATAPPIAGLRYYSPEVHRAAFVLPPYIRALLAAEAGECGEHPLQDGP